MKNALIAFDKFKDALSAHDACRAAATAVSETKPDWKVFLSPLADGGDGFCDTLTRVCDGRFNTVNVTGPLGKPTDARYGIVETAKIADKARELLQLPDEVETLAIVEFAQSSGIALVPQEERSPWTTTSFGLGETILKAKQEGAGAILIGLGGSATHDLALGALQSLGYVFLSADQTPIDEIPVPKRWESIRSIQAPDSPFGLPVRVACDVENPLLGSSGAAAVFGPQKGLQRSDYDLLESETARLAILLSHATHTGIQFMDTPGSGAAGGSAFGFMAGLDGQLVPGAELVFSWTNLHEKLSQSDIVLTGEGRFDASSMQGKGPGALAQLALEKGKELLVFAGSLGELPDASITERCTVISPSELPLSEALALTEANLKAAIRTRLSQGEG